jgi:hypothetical protein
MARLYSPATTVRFTLLFGDWGRQHVFQRIGKEVDQFMLEAVRITRPRTSSSLTHLCNGQYAELEE